MNKIISYEITKIIGHENVLRSAQFATILSFIPVFDRFLNYLLDEM
jgi:hypothetical protein